MVHIHDNMLENQSFEEMLSELDENIRRIKAEIAGVENDDDDK